MDQDRVLRALRKPAAYPHDVDTVEVVETHISWVFLTGRFAYKVKKALKLPFVDFSTLALRHRYCCDELELNRRLAPDLYVEVVAIGVVDNAVRIGTEPAVEYAVKMKQFPPAATADHLLATDPPDPARFGDFGRRLAEFHGSLPAATKHDPAAEVLTNLDELEALSESIDAVILAPIATYLRSEARRLGPRFVERMRDGFVRECHGDLHLGNLALIDGSLTAFDCLEFDVGLRTIDTMDEAAFLIMDLEARERSDLAFAFVNAYLEISGDYEGLRLLHFYATHRALVRAKVAALAADEGAASANGKVSRYLDTAAALCRTRRPLLVITFGLSGSGKTTIARELSGRIDAIHMRSDVERKRLHGLAPGERSHSGVGQGIYDDTASAKTYGHLAWAAEAALAGGLNTIVDASFLARAERDRFFRLARESQAEFVILACRASEQELRARIRERQQAGSDASEADTSVLDHQLETVDELGADEQARVVCVATEKPGTDLEGLVRSLIGRSG